MAEQAIDFASVALDPAAAPSEKSPTDKRPDLSIPATIAVGDKVIKGLLIYNAMFGTCAFIDQAHAKRNAIYSSIFKVPLLVFLLAIMALFLVWGFTFDDPTFTLLEDDFSISALKVAGFSLLAMVAIFVVWVLVPNSGSSWRVELSAALRGELTAIHDRAKARLGALKEPLAKGFGGSFKTGLATGLAEQAAGLVLPGAGPKLAAELLVGSESSLEQRQEQVKIDEAAALVSCLFAAGKGGLPSAKP